jgi:hypothetical protein
MKFRNLRHWINGLLPFVLICSCATNRQQYFLRSSWLEFEHLTSSGAQAIWEKTDRSKTDTITFFRNTLQLHNGWVRKFNITGLNSNDKSLEIYSGQDTLHWSIKTISRDTIEISFDCIEACSKRYRRIKDV